MNSFITKSIITFIFICHITTSASSLYADNANNVLAPRSHLLSSHNLFLEACKHFYALARGDIKIKMFKSVKYKFSMTPSRDAWKNLFIVKNALGTPDEYKKPLTSKSYDYITQPKILLALANSFVQFFPAYDKYGKIRRINKKQLKKLVESLKWSPEKRRKMFFDPVKLENMIKEMEDASNPNTLGGSWISGVYRPHMILYKENILNSRYNPNKVFPLTVFLHELIHSLPGYNETMFNDTLAFAFMSFLGIANHDINVLDSDENFMHLVSPEKAIPFKYENLQKDIEQLVHHTNWVFETGNRNPVRHTFLRSFSVWYSEPYLMNRHIGLYIGTRFSSVLSHLQAVPGIDNNTAYLLAKEDMLEALRLIYEYLINSLGSKYYFLQTGRTRPITVKYIKPSMERRLYIAA